MTMETRGTLKGRSKKRSHNQQKSTAFQEGVRDEVV